MISKFNYDLSYPKGKKKEKKLWQYLNSVGRKYGLWSVPFLAAVAKLRSGCAIETSNLELGTSKLSEPFFGEAYHHI